MAAFNVMKQPKLNNLSQSSTITKNDIEDLIQCVKKLYLEKELLWIDSKLIKTETKTDIDNELDPKT